MPEPTDDLITWLRAQLDDDERVAKTVTDDCWFDCTGDGHGDHHLRWDPARVLAEVDAKRRILERCAQAYREQGIYGEDGQEQVAEDLHLLLALPYADRPGYREEWKP